MGPTAQIRQNILLIKSTLSSIDYKFDEPYYYFEPFSDVPIELVELKDGRLYDKDGNDYVFHEIDWPILCEIYDVIFTKNHIIP